MLILTKSIMAMMIGFIFAAIIGLTIIPLLKKLHASQSLSIYLQRTHKSKEGTPTMGGLIFIISTILITLIFIYLKKIEITYTLIIIIFTFLSYGLIGFIDDYLIIKKHNNKGLTKGQKFNLQVIVAIIFFYLFMKSGSEPLLWIHSLNIKIDIGWLYGVFILFILVASSNAVNLTDGLDGLAGGLSVISFLTFGIISWNTGWLEGYYRTESRTVHENADCRAGWRWRRIGLPNCRLEYERRADRISPSGRYLYAGRCR